MFHLHGVNSRHQKEIENNQDKKNVYVEALDCVVMMRGDVLKKYGLFDSDLFLAHVETEWCLRITNKGYKCLYVPDSVVWHKVSASFKTDINKGEDENETEVSIYYYIRNWILLVKKNKPPIYFLSNLFLQSTLFALIRAMRYAKHDNLFLMKTYYIAIWDALINKTPQELYPYKKMISQNN